MRVLVRLAGWFCVLGFAHCGPAPQVTLTCEDILSEEQTSFKEVASILGGYCGGCHTSTNPIYGYDFSTPQAAWRSGFYRAEKVYEQIATGQMPPGAAYLDDEYVRAFRSWYCRGGLYDAIE